MENQENTYQNPDPDPISGQEENSSTVETTESTPENTLPTEPAEALTPSTEEFEPAHDELKEDHEELKEDHEELKEDHEEHEDHEDELTEEIAGQIVQEAGEDYDSKSRAELIDMLKTAVEDPDINSVKTRIALIKVAYLKKKKEEHLQKYQQALTEGETAEEPSNAEQDELDKQFNEYFSIYKANKARFTEVLEKQKKENLRKKLEILEKLKILCDSEETLKKTYDEFRSLQDQWKQAGIVPRTEINNLWQNYHFQVERFFEKVKLNKELKDLDLKKNLEAKISICEKTEELLLETSALRSFKKLQKFHEEWKEIGPVPTDKKDELWERFKNATDKINERRREHYARIEDEQKVNLDTKTALCDQAEEVLAQNNETIRDWQDHTNKVNELLNIWKSVGPVPQKVNATIWNRFKTSLDTFFANKKEFFDKLKDQQVQNYNLKVELCVQAEGLKTSTDWKRTTNELIRLQNEWKKIGPVPKKHSDKVWKRFRAACDEFFSAKAAYFSNIHTHEEENLAKKIELMNKLKAFQFTENKSENLDTLKNFQREWTDIGHIPIKDKDRLQNEFRTLINEQLDKLRISEAEMSAATFQNRLDSIKGDPQSKKIIFRERELLASKITKLRDDINLWENNIGFLANSKNADILKTEFEQKINKAKSDLKVMEAKLKILRTQG